MPGAMVTTRMRCCAFRRRIGRLPDLPVERRDRRGIDDDAALLAHRIGSGEARRELRNDIEATNQVDLDGPAKSIERVRDILLADRFDRRSDARAIDKNSCGTMRGIGGSESACHARLIGNIHVRE